MTVLQLLRQNRSYRRLWMGQVVSEIGKLNPDVLIPMHCSGLNFTQEAQRQLPGKVLTTTTGTRITFGI